MDTGRSIVRDWAKLRDWEVLELARRMYPEAVEEARRRGLEVREAQRGEGTYRTFFSRTEHPGIVI